MDIAIAHDCVQISHSKVAMLVYDVWVQLKPSVMNIKVYAKNKKNFPLIL